MSYALAAFVTSLLLTWWFSGPFSPLRMHDTPNERSLHDRPTPRSGGLAILAGIASGWLWLALEGPVPEAVPVIAGAAGVVAAVSLLDDIFDLSSLLRLGVHLLAAVMLVAGGMALPGGLPAATLTVLALAWMLNLYNFMDGMDGFAGGMSVIGFGAMAAAGWFHGDGLFAAWAAVIALAALGFLPLNWPPARIFMGDAGSATLGLLAGALALWGVRDGVFPLWFPLLVFSPFIVDATVTLTRRALRGEKVWQAHREHYYQRLALAGWGHKKTVLAEYALMLAAGASALIMLYSYRAVVPGLIGWTVVYVLLARRVERFCPGQP